MKAKQKPKKKDTVNVALPRKVHARLRDRAKEERYPIHFLAAKAVLDYLDGTVELKA